jgi:hypothetical protein
MSITWQSAKFSIEQSNHLLKADFIIAGVMSNLPTSSDGQVAIHSISLQSIYMLMQNKKSKEKNVKL